MRVSRLALTNFRSYQRVVLDLPPGAVSFVGPNGAGKTNLVEAIHYLSTLSSHRVATDAPLVLSGAEAAIIAATVERSGRSLTIELTLAARGANSARIHGNAVRPREVAGILRTVVFSPEDLDLAKGDPSARRRFLDEVGIALSPPLAGDLSDYERVLRQRSTLLKTARGKPADLGTLDVWDEKAAVLGARIARSRLDTVAALGPHTAAAYSDIAPGVNGLGMRYAPSDDAAGEFGDLGRDEIAARLLEAMGRSRGRELERGVCLVGPHRDDLELSIGALPARGYASHGESWSAALALRLGTYRLLTAAGGPDADPDGEPVLILDDVFAELDTRRRAALAEWAGAAGQVIITAAVEEDVPRGVEGSVFVVGGGEVTERGQA